MCFVVSVVVPSLMEYLELVVEPSGLRVLFVTLPTVAPVEMGAEDFHFA